MKRTAIVIILLVAFIAGFGFYRGWFTVNQDVIRQDEQTAKEKVHELEQKVKDEAAELRDKATSSNEKIHPAQQ